MVRRSTSDWRIAGSIPAYGSKCHLGKMLNPTLLPVLQRLSRGYTLTVWMCVGEWNHNCKLFWAFKEQTKENKNTINWKLQYKYIKSNQPLYFVYLVTTSPLTTFLLLALLLSIHIFCVTFLIIAIFHYKITVFQSKIHLVLWTFQNDIEIKIPFNQSVLI